MEIREFGDRLRKLRKQAGFSQRELADYVGVDFTYLSKIENGALPPPSEKVILRLAKVLNVDVDELMTLAAKIPSDIVQILKNREAIQLLRSDRVQKENAVVLEKDDDGTAENGGGPKKFIRLAAGIVLTSAVAVLLWFALPVSETATASNSQGILYNNNREYQEAAAAFTKAINLDSDFAVAYANRAWTYIKLGRFEEAIADCTKAIELDPGLATAYNSRGWANTKLGRYEQAIEDFNKAVELDPSLQK